MLTLFAFMLGLAAGEQQAASGTIISADEIAATLTKSIANNTVDQPIKLAELPGGHKASVAMLRRTKAETSALIHDYVTEIYTPLYTLSLHDALPISSPPRRRR